MIKVVIESPYAGNVEENMRYLISCIRDSIHRGEAPFASHFMYTKSLDDSIHTERELGILAGFAWHTSADVIVFYVDRGVSGGMKRSYESNTGRKMEFRSLRKKTPDTIQEINGYLDPIGKSSEDVSFCE